MRYLIVGAGGIGGYFGARLAADGNDVTFQVRGRQAAAMAERGLTLLSPLGDVTIEKPQLLSALDFPGHFDAVLLCTKLWDLEAAAETIKPLLAHDSFVATLQNGVEGEDIVAAVVGRRHVVGGVAEISAHIEEPGVIRHHGELARLAFGELDGTRSWRLEALEAALSAAGVNVRLSNDIAIAIWQKFVLLSSFAGVTAYRRQSVGEVFSDPVSKALYADLVREAEAVARAKGVALPADAAEKAIAVLDRFPPGVKSSMLVDLEQGNRLELPWLSGAVARLGAEFGVATPRHAEVTAALAPFVDGGGKAAPSA